MEYAGGELANSRKHQFKMYGSYQIASEWLASANVLIASGTPISCLGGYGTAQNAPGLGYSSVYHWCGGVPSRPGDAGHTPWQYTLTGSIEYRPEWADKKLALNVTVFNILDQRKETQLYTRYGTSAAVNPRYNVPYYQTTPRYARFGISYDF
jgi:hypothetical protein